MAVTEGTPIEGKVGRAADFFTNVKTLLAMAVALLVGVFVAGMYFSDGIKSVTEAMDKIKNHDVSIGKLNTDATALRVNVEEMESSATTLITGLKTWSPTSDRGAVTGLKGGVEYGTSMCPDGYYMVGIQSWGSTPGTKYCIGCLVAAQVICKPLNVANQ